MACVYILINSAIPGLLKIGFTGNSAAQRAYDISCATGVPSPYVVAWEIEIESANDAYEVEQHVHAELDRYRHNATREFFCCQIGFAAECIERIAFDRKVMSIKNHDVVLRLTEKQQEAERIAFAEVILIEYFLLTGHTNEAAKTNAKAAISRLHKSSGFPYDAILSSNLDSGKIKNDPRWRDLELKQRKLNAEKKIAELSIKIDETEFSAWEKIMLFSLSPINAIAISVSTYLLMTILESDAIAAIAVWIWVVLLIGVMSNISSYFGGRNDSRGLLLQKKVNIAYLQAEMEQLRNNLAGPSGVKSVVKSFSC
jgi:T5orf172 domain